MNENLTNGMEKLEKLTLKSYFSNHLISFCFLITYRLEHLDSLIYLHSQLKEFYIHVIDCNDLLLTLRF